MRKWNLLRLPLWLFLPLLVALLLLMPDGEHPVYAGTVPPLPYDLSLTKHDGGVSSVSPGEVLEYTLHYRNKVATEVSNVTITEIVPAHTVFVGPEDEWSCDEGDPAGTICKHIVPELEENEAGTVSFSVRVVNRQIPAGVKAILNTATISSPDFDQVDDHPEDNTATATTILNAAPDLYVAKTNGLGTVAPGDVLVYNISYGNRGNQAASGVFLAETLPAGTEFVAESSTSGWVFDGAAGKYIFAVGNLNGQDGPNSTGSALFAVRVINPAPAGLTTIDNTVTIAETGNNGEPQGSLGDNTASTSTLLVAAADLSLTKTDNNATATPGGVVTYVLTVKNIGSQQATGVTIIETVPAHTTFVQEQSSDWSCDDGAPAGSVCVYTVGELDSQAEAVVTFAVQVASQIPSGVTELVNTATAGSDQQPNVVQRSEATPLQAAPDLSLLKSDGGASAQPGDVVVYTLTYENKGNQVATGVVITEQVPTNTTFQIKASTPGWNCTNLTCTFTVGALAPGKRSTVDFAVQVNSNLPAGVTTVTNTARIADDQTNGADLNESDNVATDTTLLAVTNLTATKRATLKRDVNGNGEVNPGDTLEYTIEIQNNGNTAVTGLILNDTIDPNTTLVANSVQAAQGVVSNLNPLRVSIGTLAARARTTIVFQVTINRPLPANVSRIENQATITSNEVAAIATDDPSVTGINNPTRTPVFGNAVLVVTKTDLLFADADNNDVVSPGDRLLYRMRIENRGDIAATNVVLKDTPDSNTTLVVGTVQANTGAIVAGNQPNQRNVEVNIGALPVGMVANVGFLVTINENLTTDQVTNQATVTYESTGNPLGGQSDDPDTLTAGDATVTSVVRNSGIYLPLIWR